MTADSTLVQKLCILFDRTDRLQALGLLLLMIIGAALEMLAVSMLAPLIESLSSPGAPPSAPLAVVLKSLPATSSHGAYVFSLLAVLLALYATKNVFFVVLFYLQNLFGFSKQDKLSVRLFSRYLYLPYTLHLQFNTADLQRSLTHEIDQVVWSIVLPGLMLLTEALIAISLGLLLFYTNPQAAFVIIMLFGSVGFIYYRLFRDRQASWGASRLHHDGLRVRAVYEGLHGIKELKVLRRLDYFLHRFAHHNRQSGAANRKQNLVISSNLLLLETLGVSSLLILVGLHMAQGKAFDTILPMMGLFAGAAFRLIPASNRIINSFQHIRYTGPVIQKLCEELSLPAEEIPSARARKPFIGEIRLEHVSYTYAGRERPVIRDISLTIPRGEMVGLIGPSGVGKTTLIQLLLGLLSPTNGQISMDGVDVREDLAAWQQRIGYIPQDTYLRDGTIRQNVAFGVEEVAIDEHRIACAIRDAQLESFVSALPAGLETPIGELGKQLSGGQRQRIGIARALYHDPEILIFDEATSSLDQATESSVMQAIENLAGSKTIFVISHRLHSLLGCKLTYELTREGLRKLDRQMLASRIQASTDSQIIPRDEVR